MKTSKMTLWLLMLVASFALALTGCSGGNSPVTQKQEGYKLDITGTVEVPKSSAKTVAAAVPPTNTVAVYDASTGLKLGTSVPIVDGKFSGLTYTLTSTKTTVVYVADVAGGPLRYILPLDLSNPPAGVLTNNPITIAISQDSTNTVKAFEAEAGVVGFIGDGTAKTTLDFATVSAMVVKYNGTVLAYTTNGIKLSGAVSVSSLLPAQDANTLDANALNNTLLDGGIVSVFIPDAAISKPVVNFQVVNKATGKGIRGLKAFNLVIAQLKPAANGSPSEWLSYEVSSATTRPSTDSGYTVIDNGDGSYTVIFAKDIKGGTGGTVVYDATLTHRLMVGVRTAPVTALLQNGSTLSNFYNEKYFLKDFIPATPGVTPTEQRNITTTEACNECHTKIGVTTPHGGRGDVRYCMMCHTAQRANGRTNSASVAGAFTGTTYIADGEVTLDMVPMIHKIHMGNKLTKTGYNLAGILANGISYPKEINNCRQCHRGDDAAQLALAPQANNWKDKPSRKSCGSCHDNINFATGANLKVGGAAHAAVTDDSLCSACHSATSIETYHMSVNATVNNPKVPAGLTNFTYEINSVTVNGSNQPVVKFRIMASTDGSTPAPVSFIQHATNPLPGFTGAPSFLVAYADNNVDFNLPGRPAGQPASVSIAKLVDTAVDLAAKTTTGTQGSMTGPDATGYYTATLNGPTTTTAQTIQAVAIAPNPALFPANSKMRTVALQGYFTQIAPAAPRHAISVVKTVTGDTVRRTAIDPAKCGNCHEWFEGHGGNRVIGKETTGINVCVVCHNPSLSSSGRSLPDANLASMVISDANIAILTTWGYTIDPTSKKFTGLAANAALTFPEAAQNFKDLIHGIHAGGTRTNPLRFVRHGSSAGALLPFDAKPFTFPGILKQCDMCHTATGYTSIPAGALVTTDVTDNGAITTFTGVVTARGSVPNATDKVTTPFAAACVTCHDAPSAKAHITQMGGQIQVLRSTANPANEACVTCHGTTGPNSLLNTHRFTVVGE